MRELAAIWDTNALSLVLSLNGSRKRAFCWFALLQHLVHARTARVSLDDHFYSHSRPGSRTRACPRSKGILDAGKRNRRCEYWWSVSSKRVSVRARSIRSECSRHSDAATVVGADAGLAIDLW